jgi:hypothetical protein
MMQNHDVIVAIPQRFCNFESPVTTAVINDEKLTVKGKPFEFRQYIGNGMGKRQLFIECRHYYTYIFTAHDMLPANCILLPAFK